MFEKLVLVTRKTRLSVLIERFNTRAQAKFYLERAGLDFDDYDAEDQVYRRSIDALITQFDGLGLKLQVLERALLSTYLFSAQDLVVAAGQDGLVANTAKYIGTQPLVGVNPDPSRFDGQLLPFSVDDARAAVERTVEGKARVREVTLAEARLSDGQRLLAFNDFFVGAQSHVSAVYRLRVKGAETKDGWERQSSSGVLVSTGAGSTGWLSSVCNMTANVSRLLGGAAVTPVKMSWEDPRLFFVVREPFVSRHSAATCTAGWLSGGQTLELESLMPSGGVLFSDGIEADYLQFTSGRVAQIGPASLKARLVAR